MFLQYSCDEYLIYTENYAWGKNLTQNKPFFRSFLQSTIFKKRQAIKLANTKHDSPYMTPSNNHFKFI